MNVNHAKHLNITLNHRLCNCLFPEGRRSSSKGWIVDQVVTTQRSHPSTPTAHHDLEDRQVDHLHRSRSRSIDELRLSRSITREEPRLASHPHLSPPSHSIPTMTTGTSQRISTATTHPPIQPTILDSIILSSPSSSFINRSSIRFWM